VDGGAEATTTHLRHLLSDFVALPKFQKRLVDAGGRVHRATGEGYLKTAYSETFNGKEDLVYIHCWYKLPLPVTVISPGDFCRQHKTRYRGYFTYSDQVDSTGYVQLHATLTHSQDRYISCITKGI
jgi:hypothetical protein